MRKKIGLLICDQIKEPLRQAHGDYLHMYQQLLPGFDFETYHVYQHQFPKDINDHEVYLCSGSSFSVYENESWIKELTSFIQQIQKSAVKLIGICFGHQMIAHALGGKVEKAKVGWCVGVHRFGLIASKPWMTPHRDDLHLLMLCQDQVIDLPPGAEILYGGEDCPVAVFSLGNNIIGIQAHPEFSKMYKAAIIEMRKEKIGEVKSSAALESLDLEIDTSAITSWLTKFISK